MSRKKFVPLKIDGNTFRQIKKDIRNKNLSRQQIICHFGIGSSTYSLIKASKSFADYKGKLKAKNDRQKKNLQKRVEQALKMRQRQIKHIKIPSYPKVDDLRALAICLWISFVFCVVFLLFTIVFTGGVR